MEKALWKFATCVAMVLLSFSFSSCGDDDNEFSDSDLIGTWKCVANEGYYTIFEEDREKHPFKNDRVGMIWTFSSDYTITTGDDTGEWTLKKDRLLIIVEGESSGNSSGKIIELSGSKMIIELHNIDEDYEFYDKATFEKVK